MSEQEYEYYLEIRERVLGRSRWSRERGTYIEKVENPEWSDWRDGSGYNKEGSIYAKLSYIKIRLGQLKRVSKRGTVEFEARLFRRPVPPPPPWEPVELP